jgi:small subunit ribosomal protein S20
LEGGNLATHVSAQKRARQSEKKRLRNAALKSLLKTSARKVLLAVEEKNVEEARKALARAVPAIQKIASKKVIHKKTAARKISRLAKKVNTLTSPA